MRLSPGVGNGARFGSLTLAHLLRWRLRNAGVEKGAEISSLTLAHPFRWRLTNASAVDRAKFGYPTLAHLLSEHWEALRSLAKSASPLNSPTTRK